MTCAKICSSARIAAAARAEQAKSLASVLDLFPILGERTSQLAARSRSETADVRHRRRGLMTKPRLLMLDEPTLGIARPRPEISNGSRHHRAGRHHSSSWSRRAPALALAHRPAC